MNVRLDAVTLGLAIYSLACGHRSADESSLSVDRPGNDHGLLAVETTSTTYQTQGHPFRALPLADGKVLVSITVSPL